MRFHPLTASLASTFALLTTAFHGAHATNLQDEDPPVAEEEVLKLDDRQAIEGFLPLYIGDDGSVLAALPAPTDDGVSLRFIHAMRLRAGLGSNPLGLDRGWGSYGDVVRFSVVGQRVIAEVENHTYRATADSAAEKTAVAQSFGRSIIWAGKVEEQLDDGRFVVDLTSLLTTDLLGLAGRLKEGSGGSFSLDSNRSFVEPSGIKGFPQNTEVDVTMTFKSSDPGRQVRETAPYPGAVTVTVHHSFVALPDDGYRVRMADPRLGTFQLQIYDFSAPLSDQVHQSLAMRHRLAFNEPGNPASGIAEPIVFYVDPGAPDQIREALIEGASWWSDAFDAAGLEGAFRVEVLPEGADPLDIRYNVIQWVHRQTRGWSYGGAITDPRTGEMLKGHVILGSQRVRQDRMIFEGLLGVDQTGTGADQDPVELSLDRIRQLSAHEVAHALGFGHNFAASTNGRASVTDYPAPFVVAKADESLDASGAYDSGIGAWDKTTVAWLYGIFPEDEEQERLDAIVNDARTKGLLFIEDGDGRGAGTAHPMASVWDNGDDPVAELTNVMRVRQIALARFDASRLANGHETASLHDVLVPIYLYHRYQTASAAKSIGGMRYQYAVNGKDSPAPSPVPADVQTRALNAVVSTLLPAALDLSDDTVAALGARSGRMIDSSVRETFASRTGATFDFLSAIEAAADLTLDALLAPARLERLAAQSTFDDSLPSIDDVLRRIDATVFDTPLTTTREAGIAEAVRGRYVQRLMELQASGTLSQWAAAPVHAHLVALRRELGGAGDPHLSWLASEIDAHLERPAPAKAPGADASRPPPGSPIGMPHMTTTEACWHCDQ